MKQICKYIAMFLGVLLSVNLVPNVEKLYNEGISPSFGINEVAVFLTHFILGLTAYFIFIIFDKNKYVYFLILLLILYLGLLDYQVFLYGTSKIIIGLVIMRIIQISIMFLLHKSGFIKYNLFVCLFIYVLLLFWGDFFGFRFYKIINVLG